MRRLIAYNVSEFSVNSHVFFVSSPLNMFFMFSFLKAFSVLPMLSKNLRTLTMKKLLFGYRFKRHLRAMQRLQSFSYSMAWYFFFFFFKSWSIDLLAASVIHLLIFHVKLIFSAVSLRKLAYFVFSSLTVN